MSSDNTDTPPSSSRSRRQQSNWPPYLKIFRPPQGKYSPRTDERCFTYCSQSSRGRTDSREPWCRSICIRRVFQHEVRNAIANASNSEHPSPDTSLSYPLPPEGQPQHGGMNRTPGASSQGDKFPRKDTEYWEEGWYLWWSKGRFAAQEKFNLMSWDVKRQAELLQRKEKEKERIRRNWVKSDKDTILHEVRAADRPATPDEPAGASDTRAVKPPARAPPQSPYPNTRNDSVLVRIQPAIPPIYQQVQTLLAPSRKLMTLLRESVESGSQKQFAILIWEKAWTKEPYVLASNTWERVWKVWKNGPPDDSTAEKGL